MSSEGYVLADGRATGLPEDLVHVLAGVLEWYGCDMGPFGTDAAAHAILSMQAWRERQAAERWAHERRHEEAARETRTILDLAEARRRTRIQAGTGQG